jgi:hypothetical protein
MREARQGLCAWQGRTYARCKAELKHEASRADTRGKDGQMLEARQTISARLGRCAMQGKANVRGNARQMREAMQGRCARQADEQFKAIQMRDARQGGRAM